MVKLRPSHLLFVGLIAASSLLLGCPSNQSSTSNTPKTTLDGTGTVYKSVVELTDDMDDAAEWGKNYPYHYEDFQKTAEMEATKYGGSKKIARTPTADDPREFVAASKIDPAEGGDARLKIMWANMPFSKDFREERGHFYNRLDQLLTGRQKAAQQPGACLNCHASSYVAHKKAGNGNLEAGFVALNQMKFQDAIQHTPHALSCIDCHDAKTMQLRVTRQGFIDAIRDVKALEGIPNYDVNKMATKQEMRSYTCGQCHVEYYFKGTEKRLVFPWQKGLKVDDIYAVYKENGFKDWVHAKTGTDALKAQHPEFELYNQGIHAKSGVSCADCHMPKKVAAGVEITDHHVRSPLLNVKNSCKSCHRQSEAELKARVEAIQDRTHKLKDQTLDALVELIADIEAASASADPTKLAKARELHRKGQFYFDFVEAENSNGFHAPDEANRILGEAINYLRQGQLELLK